MIPGNLWIVDNKITEDSFHRLDPKWPGRGYWNPHTHDFVLNIPKNGSNTLGNTLCSRDIGWQARNHLTEDFPINKFVVVYRDPIERWKGCMAEHLSHRVEYGEHYEDVVEFVHSKQWCTPFYSDMHLFSQAAYSQGVDLSRTIFYWLDAGVAPIYQHLNVTAPEVKLNASRVHNKNNRQEIREAIESVYQRDLTTRNFVSDLYASDYELFGKIHILGKKRPLMF